MPGRTEHELTEAFVRLADPLADGYDVIDLLHELAVTCVRLLPVDAAGLLIYDDSGDLRVVSSSGEDAHLLELFQLESDEGPCLDAFRSGEPVGVPELAEQRQRWPRYADLAIQTGFRSVYAIPMRHRDNTIGALNLLRMARGPVAEADLRIARALADAATIGILAERAIREHRERAGQLQEALNSRIVIEQAKGMLAERTGLSMEQAFTVLRGYARNNNQRLTNVAAAVIDGSLGSDLLTGRDQDSAGAVEESG
jgi:transcriptional regulator with GAF, ATPase, and Fis domain